MFKPKDRRNAWRKANKKFRNKCRKANYDKSKPPRQPAKRRPSGVKHFPWSEAEKACLGLSGIPDRTIAKYLGRSVGAIQTMRNKINVAKQSD